MFEYEIKSKALMTKLTIVNGYVTCYTVKEGTVEMDPVIFTLGGVVQGDDSIHRFLHNPFKKDEDKPHQHLKMPQDTKESSIVNLRNILSSFTQFQSNSKSREQAYAKLKTSFDENLEKINKDQDKLEPWEEVMLSIQYDNNKEKIQMHITERNKSRIEQLEKRRKNILDNYDFKTDFIPKNEITDVLKQYETYLNNKKNYAIEKIMSYAISFFLFSQASGVFLKRDQALELSLTEQHILDYCRLLEQLHKDLLSYQMHGDIDSMKSVEETIAMLLTHPCYSGNLNNVPEELNSSFSRFSTALNDINTAVKSESKGKENESNTISHITKYVFSFFVSSKPEPRYVAQFSSDNKPKGLTPGQGNNG